ncbi:MAG: DUF4279 domain-containing protein [Pirellulaceae bacterium]|nr:DUF4279 domain-containing protein [Pirellulaceae bacterium]
MNLISFPTNHRLTPINPRYPSCERVCAELVVYPHEFTAADVSKILECMPTDAVNKGDLRQTSGKVYPRTVWSLSSENMLDSKDLRDHIDLLLARIEFTSAKIQSLSRDNELRLAVKCIWWSKSGTGGPTLWPEQMQMLANLGIECTFDICFFGDDES